ncbi:MAG: hypothetical protein A2W91_01725 [Bacteroidetes bacterium GWF2_38_335]|nr:MAG: hypothetical protein A2W91_01725 [Bacteroidetes bacterium GWF2_38_335]OFY78788.1 MAG: hypothetical protein A2281_19300 [Bacteroidetes bacterium RIFOXYA12_FULL_38_20]HBS85183.1 hypothetical protein [Bacteroidales bacterium]
MKNIVFLIFAFATICLSAQSTFEKNYGDPSVIEEGQDVVQTSDGGFLAACFKMSDVFLLKTDADGIEQWNKTFDLDYPVQVTCIEKTSDGGYIIGGYSGTYETDFDFFLMKLDAACDSVWTKTFGTTVKDKAYAVKQTADGGFALAGTTETTDVNYNGWMVKTDASGNQQWAQTFGGSSYDYVYDMTLTTDGGFLCCGSTSSYAGGTGAFFIKLNSSGVEQWHKRYGGETAGAGYAFGIDNTFDNGFIATGMHGSFYLLRLDGNGDTLWTKNPSVDFFLTGIDVVQTTGGYVVAGYETTYEPEGFDVVLRKYDESGTKLWSKNFSGDNSGYVTRMIGTSDNGFAVTGKYEYLDGGSVENTNIYLIKTDENGEGCFGYLTGLQEICMVTVDNATGKNKVIWTPEEPASAYNIYKLTTEGYEVIGTVNATELSEYVDMTSNPGTASDRYKVSIIDTCGNETLTGDYHKTIHLNVSPGVPSGFALTWEHYEGFTFTKYRIFRGTAAGGLVQIDSTLSSNFTYTDTTSLTGALYYQVAAVKPVPCYSSSTGAKDVGGPFSQSVSNLEDNGVGGNVDELSSDKYNISIYPNPASNESQISYKLMTPSQVNIELVSITSKTVLSVHYDKKIPGTYTEKLNLEKLEQGSYFLRITIENKTINRKIEIIR